MKKQEAILVSAFTGFLLTKDFSDVYKFCEDLIGRPIWTHEFASRTVQEEIKEKCRPLILELIENETDADHPTEKCGSCEWAMPIKGTINGVYVSYIECQNPEKVWNHNSSRRKKRTTPKCRFWQPKKKGGEG